VTLFDLLADADDIIYHLNVALAIDIVGGLVGYIDAHTRLSDT
jgi:hypothetical protein